MALSMEIDVDAVVCTVVLALQVLDERPLVDIQYRPDWNADRTTHRGLIAGRYRSASTELVPGRHIHAWRVVVGDDGRETHLYQDDIRRICRRPDHIVDDRLLS